MSSVILKTMKQNTSVVLKSHDKKFRLMGPTAGNSNSIYFRGGLLIFKFLTEFYYMANFKKQHATWLSNFTNIYGKHTTYKAAF